MLERKYFHDLFGGEAGVGSIAASVVLVNDPLTVPLLATDLESAALVANHYEFQVMTGRWHGLPISICSTGIGGGSATIAIDNLVRLGAQSMIYVDVGQTERPGGWVATGAVRQDGASLDYVRAEFPATADSEVLLAVLQASQELDVLVEPALLWASVGAPSVEKLNVIKAYGVRQELSAYPGSVPLVLTPAEPATILTLATLYRIRAGSIYLGLADISNLNTALRQVFLLALHSLRFLQRWDEKKYRNSWKMTTPSST
jgi:uridine phosphorylase